MNNDFIKLAKRRKTTYNFTTRVVSNAKIKKILEAGRWSSSSQNSQPWKFVVVKDKKKIEKLMLLSYYGGFHTDCAAMIVLVLDPIYKNQDGLLKNTFKEYAPSHKYMNIGFACSNISHAATYLDVDNCILSLKVDEANKLLSVPKGSEALLAIGLGYESKDNPVERSERLGLKDIVYKDKYGVSYLK